VKYPLLFINLFFADVALGDEIIVLSLVLEVGQVDLIHDPCIILLKQLHVLNEVLLVILEHCFNSFLTFLVLAHNQIISLGLSAGQECLQLLIHVEVLINR
jgi:hypothetical protein